MLFVLANFVRSSVASVNTTRSCLASFARLYLIKVGLSLAKYIVETWQYGILWSSQKKGEESVLQCPGKFPYYVLFITDSNFSAIKASLYCHKVCALHGLLCISMMNAYCSCRFSGTQDFSPIHCMM